MDTFAHISVQISHFYLSWGGGDVASCVLTKKWIFAQKALSDSGFWAAAEADRQRHHEKTGLSMKELKDRSSLVISIYITTIWVKLIPDYNNC